MKRRVIFSISAIAFLISIIAILYLGGTRKTISINMMQHQNGIIIERKADYIKISRENSKNELSGFKLYDFGKGDKLDFVVWYDKDYYLNQNRANEKLIAYTFDIIKNKLYKKAEINEDIAEYGMVSNGILFTKKMTNNTRENIYGLYFGIKNTIPKKIMVNCARFYISPDGKKVVTIGSIKDSSAQAKWKIYCYDLVRNSYNEIKDIKIPKRLEDLYDFYVSWSKDSKYVCIDKTIIDSTKNVIKKKIKLHNENVFDFNWSSDNEQLAFKIQTKEKESEFLVVGEENVFLAEKVGIYSLKDDSVHYFKFPKELVYSILWDKSSKRLIAATLPEKEYRFISVNSINWGSEVEKHINLICAKTM